MKRLTTDEIHSELLLIFKDIIKVCDENDITYYISGGTLLGAIRHKGFIPWDDDLDLMIPRDAYDKFETVYRHSGTYTFWSKNDKDKWNTPYSRIENIDTIIDNKEVEMTHGLFVDIFPIDYVPNSKLKQMIILLIIKTLNTFRNGSRKKLNYNNIKYGYFKKIIINPVGKFVGSYRWAYMMDKFARYINKKNKDKSGFCGVIVVSYTHKLREFVTASIYDNTVKLQFEKIEVIAPSGYNDYLKSLYGDYMELPPKDMQKPTHYPVYWKENKKVEK